MSLKIKIDDDGSLYLVRAGVGKRAECPMDDRYCTDSCALFREPLIMPNREEVSLSLCHSLIMCGLNEFADERGG